MFRGAIAEANGTEVQQVVSIVEGITQEEWVHGLIALVVGLFLVRCVIMPAFRRAMNSTTIIPPSVRSILDTLLHILVLVIVFMTAAGFMGIPMTTFVAIFSVAGIAISLSVQGVLSNFVGGVNILISKPFVVGDFIESDGFSGTVTEIGMMHTRLRAPGGPINFIPNSTLIAARLINYSAAETRRVELSVSTAYRNEPEAVRTAILEAIAENPLILKDPAPVVHLETYGDSSITYTVWAWVKPSDFLSAKYALNEALYMVFRAADIEFPFPQIVVHAAEGQ
ncbi:MAG: mechanosensitive ion channel family protein [Clostridiales bacterium]|nr:mechanosensitive ion channel family protein [Clostridiales bacterium]